MSQPVIIGDARLYLGDCMEILPTLGKVDAVITDPPYGVKLGHDPSHVIGNQAYASFDDPEEAIKRDVVPLIELCIKKSLRCVVTPGTRCAWFYPRPDEIGAIYFPAGAGFSRWGFTCSQPILYYGKDPYMPKNKKPNSYRCTETTEKNGHPCPKPVGLMVWLVDRCTLGQDVVLDPFMGSGTTGVACANLGRSFIGIEREPKYFDIACRRIEQAYKQRPLFEAEPQRQPEQLGLVA